MLVYEASMQNNLMSTLAAGGITPSNKRHYTIGQVGFLHTESVALPHNSIFN